jgi:hypothetical protein
VAVINLFQLAFALSHKLGSITTGTDFVGFLFKMGLLTVCFGLFLALVHFGVGKQAKGLVQLLSYLAIMVPVSCLFYFYLAYRLGFDEVDHLLKMFRRKTGLSS